MYYAVNNYQVKRNFDLLCIHTEKTCRHKHWGVIHEDTHLEIRDLLSDGGIDGGPLWKLTQPHCPVLSTGTVQPLHRVAASDERWGKTVHWHSLVVPKTREHRLVS